MTGTAKKPIVLGVPNVYCSICKTADVPAWDWRLHGEPCKSKGRVAAESVQNFMTALAALFRDDVAFASDGWQIRLQSGGTRIKLLVTEVQVD